MKNVTIKFGLSNQLTRSFPDSATVEQIVQDSAVKTALGYGDNVTYAINGVNQPGNAQVEDGEEISVAQAACRKG